MKETKGDNKLRVLSLFSGIGAFEKALSNKGYNFDIVSFSEIDKYAVQSYSAIHNIDKSFILYYLNLILLISYSPSSSIITTP